MILASREESSIASAWREYLCLERTESGGYKLFTGQYEALEDRNKFFNEESREHHIPDEIDGKVVIGIEDDYVVGGELRYFDDEQAVIFESPDDQRVATWLHSSGWSDRIEVSAIKAAVQQL